MCSCMSISCLLCCVLFSFYVFLCIYVCVCSVFVCLCVSLSSSSSSSFSLTCLLGFGCFGRLTLCGWLMLCCQPRALPDKCIVVEVVCPDQSGRVKARGCPVFVFVVLFVVVVVCLFVCDCLSDLICVPSVGTL